MPAALKTIAVLKEFVLSIHITSFKIHIFHCIKYQNQEQFSETIVKLTTYQQKQNSSHKNLEHPLYNSCSTRHLSDQRERDHWLAWWRNVDNMEQCGWHHMPHIRYLAGNNESLIARICKVVLLWLLGTTIDKMISWHQTGWQPVNTYSMVEVVEWGRFHGLTPQSDGDCDMLM